MEKFRASVWFHYLVLLFGLLCIGWSAIFVKLADVSGFASAFYRMFIATLAIIPLWAIRSKSRPGISIIKAAALCGVFFACDIAMWNTSILLSKASIATLLANLSPVWVGLGSFFIFKQKPGRIFWIGTVISIIGVIFIIGINNLYHAGLSYGSLLAIGASVFYAAYLLSTQRVRGKLDTVTFTAISMATSSVVLLLLCFFTNTQLTGFSAKSWLSLLGLGLISQFFGWLAINWALGYIKSTAASVSLLSQTVITAIIAVPVLGEFLTVAEIFGALVVLFGVYLVNQRNFNKKQKIEPEYD
jgi:drug/metabolite transporter (DMT)-like permease